MMVALFHVTNKEMGKIIAAIALGSAAGLGLFTFHYAKGTSYLSNDPAACANCHIMNEQWGGWIKSPHRSVATCNDCHTPPNFFGKYLAKSSNGFWHSYYFTTGTFSEPIRIKPGNKRILENNCRRCHEDVVSAMDAGHESREKLSCVTCHDEVGH